VAHEMRGDGRIFQRGERWWVAYFVRGAEVREPAKVALKDGILRPAETAQEARRFLKARRREIEGGRFIGLEEERLTVADLFVDLLSRADAKGLRSVAKVKSHAKAILEYFGTSRAVDVSGTRIDSFKAERLAAGRAPATVNRELELLRQAYRLAVKRRRFSIGRAPEVELLPVDNVRQGFIERAEMEAVLAQLAKADSDVRDFVEWGFRTGMRKGEITRLTWSMLDQAGDVWALRIPGAITKNRRPRALRLDRGTEVRAIMDRRVAARRLGCPLIFHRVSQGRPGQPVKNFGNLWRNALEAVGLPAGRAREGGRIFHDLRRSAVPTLIRAGVDPSVAMKVSGHKTRAMFDRYNIIAEEETGAAFAKADAYLSTQPVERPAPESTVFPFAAVGGKKPGQNPDNPKGGARVTGEPSTPPASAPVGSIPTRFRHPGGSKLLRGLYWVFRLGQFVSPKEEAGRSCGGGFVPMATHCIGWDGAAGLTLGSPLCARRSGRP
jgi:integrase